MMTIKASLYRGNWPQNVNKTAKYAIRTDKQKHKVTVECEIGDGMKFLAVEEEHRDIVERVNAIKMEFGGGLGGAFYINEYGHLIVPVKQNESSHYYFCGVVDTDFRFDFEGKILTSKPVDDDGKPLALGDLWIGPRPGIPYVLSAGGKDIYYETPALTDTSPPEIRERATKRINLLKVTKNQSAAQENVHKVRARKGHAGGRFYVNEHQAIFTPVDEGDGIKFFYCGQINMDGWFPEPEIS